MHIAQLMQAEIVVEAAHQYWLTHVSSKLVAYKTKNNNFFITASNDLMENFMEHDIHDIFYHRHHLFPAMQTIL